MRFVPTRVHGILDYLVGALLIVAPWLLGFAQGGAETWLPVVLGAGVIVYSLLTDYELGVVKTIPMPVHLGLDAGGGVLLAISPWLFGFAGIVWVPHLIVGLIEIGAALVTRTVPYEGRATAAPAARPPGSTAPNFARKEPRPVESRTAPGTVTGTAPGTTPGGKTQQDRVGAGAPTGQQPADPHIIDRRP